MTKIDDALVRRMERLVRKIAGDEFVPNSEMNAAARAIVAELPAPVDPLLIEAREIAADIIYRAGTYCHRNVMAGCDDNSLNVQIALAAIRRGRALERGE